MGGKMIGKDWVISPVTAKRLYTTTVRPILAYGALVWASCLERTKIITTLQKVQRMACLMMTRAMRSTPTARMETVMGLVPVDCYMKKEALLVSIRLRTGGQWKHKEGETISNKAHTKLA